MEQRSHAGPFTVLRTCASLPVLLALMVSACGHQEPAFRETPTDGSDGGADARARSGDIGQSVSAGGEGAIDPEAIAAAMKNGNVSGSPDGLEGGRPTDSGGNPAGGGGPSMRDNVAKDVPKGSVSAVFGAESTLPLNWRTVQLTQGGPGKVDILWVVDTSGSMAEEQAYLASNFNSFIGSLKTAGQDFQTAVTTTDICQDQIPDNLAQRVCPVAYGGSAATHLRGSFVGDGGRRVLKRDDADLVDRFNTYTRLGVNGSGFEHGLKAAAMAVDKSLNGQNESLVRNEAFLAIIVVSDEEDDGIGLSQLDVYNGHNFVAEGLSTFKYTEDDLVTYLQGVKGKGNYSVSTIAATRLTNGTLCSAAHTQPLEEGAQYIAAAKKTGGIVQSICDTNWSQSLASIGADLSAQLAQVVLPSTPDPATIRVKVDGVEVRGWSYVTGNNAVKFDAGALPVKGANIVVGYVER